MVEIERRAFGLQHGSSRPADAALTFIGTATTLLELGSFTLLTDPNFLHRGQRAYLGKALWSRRVTEPALSPSDLPPLDAVLLSHLHGDHFDRVARAELDRSAPVLTTPAAARRLHSWGFDTEGLQPWQEIVLHRGGESLTITSVPAVHARGALRSLLPPVMGTVLEHTADGHRRRVYVSGDTLTGPHLNEIHARYPDIDTAIVHLGGTRILLHTVTMDADQGVDFLDRIRPHESVPVHHSDYPVFRSRVWDFVRAAHRAGHDRVRVVKAGQRIDLCSRPAAAGRPSATSA
ncbi:MBL fold metallo-hydrolase [Humibacillus xanthopallidus]|uniref:L-ascorbate metabolism protein UlaG (Beta-lactamase superfamily) n=1 Tax=Humibacillus xanthopallidus TaxID=412689 RepID=A0A543HHW0_9MICO|nr:MBL fold metallo-hydrolase [Humibacillus xanthopallidus]TQM57916.1 L-ascorbate metabolism protein UlaG (beta-lactamase superfamily) [Humibacillus xanthopallidus]